MNKLISHILLIAILLLPVVAVGDSANGGGGVANVYQFGGACDDSTDDSTAFVAALATLKANGGGTLNLPSMCKIASNSIVFPNDGASPPKQVPIRITCASGASTNGWWTSIANQKCGLDLTGTAGTGQAALLTEGIGTLEIDHIILKTSGTGAILKTTNTQLKIHDNTFIGSASGTSAVNDAIVLGGTLWGTGNTNAYDNFFQGYGTVIENNFFDNIRRVVTLNSAANGNVISNNTISQSCGYSTGEPFFINGYSSGGDFGNLFSSNIIECSNYAQAFTLSYASGNTFINNGIFDNGNGFIGYNLQSSSVSNLILSGYYTTTNVTILGGVAGLMPQNYLIDSTNPTRVVSSTSIPTVSSCSAATEGVHYFFKAGTGYQDYEMICVKNADNTYRWKPLFYSYLSNELIVNGNPFVSSGWNLGTGWSIANGVATKTAGTLSDLYRGVFSQNAVYQVTMTVSNYTAGSIYINTGTWAGIHRTATGTYTEIVYSGNGDSNIYIEGDATFAGSLSGISVKQLIPLDNNAGIIDYVPPTISSGFGTSPSISNQNGYRSFRINVGTGGTATSGVIGLPAAPIGWNCFCADITTSSTTVSQCKQTATSTTSATIGNFTDVTGAGAWSSGDILAVHCDPL